MAIGVHPHISGPHVHSSSRADSLLQHDVHTTLVHASLARIPPLFQIRSVTTTWCPCPLPCLTTSLVALRTMANGHLQHPPRWAGATTNFKYTECVSSRTTDVQRTYWSHGVCLANPNPLPNRQFWWRFGTQPPNGPVSLDNPNPLPNIRLMAIRHPTP